MRSTVGVRWGPTRCGMCKPAGSVPRARTMNIPRADWNPSTAWQRYCGFLGLRLESFLEIQALLLAEQMKLIGGSRLGRRLLRQTIPGTVDEFRDTVPLTDYGDYVRALEGCRTDRLPPGEYVWAHTTGAQARYKYIPYTRRAYLRLLDTLMATFIMSTARHEGDVRIRPGDVVMYNVPPRPYLSGLLVFGMEDRFGLKGVIAPAAAEEMEFKAKLRANFERGLREKVDLIISMTSVLVRAGESFDPDLKRPGRSDASAETSQRDLNWRAASRLAKAWLKSAILRRPLRAGDIWPAKGIIGWGVDTPVFRDQVKTYWGRLPYEIYACTEGGVMGMQAGEGRGLAFTPYSDFFEFIPEADSLRSREDPGFKPRVLLLNEVEPGETYEVVITNFYGIPLVRYRAGHLIRFLSREAQVHEGCPEFEFLGRSDDRLDVAGFTRIDEKTLWEAIRNSGLPLGDWTMRAEHRDEKPILHLYAEGLDSLGADAVALQVHEHLKQIDDFYRDLEVMLNIRPLRVTLLTPGTFDRLYTEKYDQGKELAELQPPRTNPDEQTVRDLVRLSEASES